MACNLFLASLFALFVFANCGPNRYMHKDDEGLNPGDLRVARSADKSTQQEEKPLVRIARGAPKRNLEEGEEPTNTPASEPNEPDQQTGGGSAQIKGDGQGAEENELTQEQMDAIKEKAAAQLSGMNNIIKTIEANQPADGHKLIDSQAKQLGLEPETPDVDQGDYKGSVDATAARWPKGIVPYTIDTASFSESEINMIHQTLQSMNTLTCVRFLEASPSVYTEAGHNNYIKIISNDGCWSYVGMVILPEQPLSLKHISCFKSRRPILHEAMHALGFHHEHARSDRDNYVDVIYSNLKNGILNTDFKEEDTINNFPYSYDSIMHYGAYVLAIDTNKKTMTSHDDLQDNVMGVQEDLSYYDIANINKYYTCQDNCASPPSPGCMAPQIADAKNCGFCSCFKGLKGQLCNQIVSTVEGAGGIFNLNNGEVKAVSSPQDGQSYKTGQFVAWFLKAPAGMRLLLDVQYIDLAAIPDSNPILCSHYVQLQISNPGEKTQNLCFSGPMKRVSETDALMILFDSTDLNYGTTGLGFLINVKPIDPGCLSKDKECVEGTCDLSGTAYKCTCREGFTGDTCSIDNDATRVYHCDFELKPSSVICPFESDSESPQQFTYHTGPTISIDTGPSGAHGGDTYIYLETSFVNKDDYASLYTKLFYVGGERCLEFWYNMNGASVGSLEVYYTSQGSPTPVSVFFQDKDEGDVWKRCAHVLPDLENIQIWFKAVRGTSYTGDIALDDISITPGNCEPHPCEANPCGCGGSCERDLNSVSGYKCTCRNGFSGDLCEVLSSSIECNYEEEESKCCFINSQQDQFDWTRKSGMTSTLNSGPDSAKSGDHYLYIEASTPRVQGDTACLESHPKIPSKEYCLEFWYSMFGDHMGDLVVSYSNADISHKELFRMSGNKGNKWYRTFHTIPGGQNTKVKICGIRGSSYRSDAAIDALSFTPGSCVSKCNCDEGCFLTDDLSDNFNWKTGTGRVAGLDSGPLSAYQGQCYMYADMSFPVKDGDTAVLKSTQSFAEKDYRLSFAYSMVGVDVGYLSINAGSKTWIRSGGKGKEWLTDCIDIPSQPDLKINVTAERAHSNSGDIAIDDFTLTRQTCGCLSNPCKAGSNCTDNDDGTYTCTCDINNAEDDPTCNRLADGNIATSFEDSDPSLFHQLNLPSDYYFSVTSGATKTWLSGPNAAAHGAKYLLAESSGRKPGEKANLEITLSFTSLPRCLKFKYHMHGSGMGSLAIYLDSVVAWYRTGNQGDQWKEGAVDFTDQKFRFEARRGIDFYSDIALDDVRVERGTCGCGQTFDIVDIMTGTTCGAGNANPSGAPDFISGFYRGCAAEPCLNGGTCQPATATCSCPNGFEGDKCKNVPADTPLSCDFEGTPCFMKQAVHDQLDFTVYSGPTRTANTGPTSAHGGKNYLYLDSSSVQGVAQLTTSHLNIKTGRRCLTFWYFMYGNDVSSLSVGVGERDNVDQKWHRTGNQGQQWLQASVEIDNTYTNVVIEITAAAGIGDMGDIAVDDIKLTPGACPAR